MLKNDHLPTELVTPASDVEGEEDGYKVFREGDNLVKADHLHQSEARIAAGLPPITAHLPLHVCVGGLVGVVLDVETPVRRMVELLL